MQQNIVIIPATARNNCELTEYDPEQRGFSDADFSVSGSTANVACFAEGGAYQLRQHPLHTLIQCAAALSSKVLDLGNKEKNIR